MKQSFKINSYAESKSGKSINIYVNKKRLYLPKLHMVDPVGLLKRLRTNARIIFDPDESTYSSGWYRVEKFELTNQVPLRAKPKTEKLLKLEMGWSAAKVRREIEKYAIVKWLKTQKMGSKWRIEDPNNGFMITFATFRIRYAYYEEDLEKVNQTKFIDLDDWTDF